ncbi:hypothetical protein RUND412_006523 [Rhizina undulata]
MSSHPSSGTMLPPAVRYAKIFGTIVAGVLAGIYYTHSAHTLSALLQANSTSEHITDTFKKLLDFSTRPFLYLINTYHHHLHLRLPHPSTTTDVHQNNFVGISGEWMFFALSAVLVGAVVPYSKFVMKKKMKEVKATDDEAVKRDLKAWRKFNWGMPGMYLRAAVVARAGVAGAS